MYKYIATLLTVVGCYSIKAQQDPQFTQYTYNLNVINPAYATSDLGTFKLGGNYRKQWAGAVGSPQTYSLFGHLPISESIEFGLTFNNDQIGEEVTEINEKNINADVAYVLKLNTNLKLALGVKAGVTIYDTTFSGRLIDNSDQAFANNVNQTFPTFGTGAYLFSDNYYVGLSAPNFLRSTQLEDDLALETLGREEIHFYLVGGYVFNLNETIKLKPSFLWREVKGAPFNLDVSLNTLLYDRFEAGISYRLNDALSGIVGFRITPALKIAYAYDATVSDFSSFNNGSHEILLLLDASLFNNKQGYKKSPRFF